MRIVVNRRSTLHTHTIIESHASNLSSCLWQWLRIRSLTWAVLQHQQLALGNTQTRTVWCWRPTESFAAKLLLLSSVIPMPACTRRRPYQDSLIKEPRHLWFFLSIKNHYSSILSGLNWLMWCESSTGLVVASALCLGFAATHLIRRTPFHSGTKAHLIKLNWEVITEHTIHWCSTNNLTMQYRRCNGTINSYSQH